MRSAAAAVALAWRSARWVLLLQMVCALTIAVLPVVVAWLTKGVIDRLVRPTGGPLTGYVAGLVGAGLLLALLPRLAGYLAAERDRAIGLRAKEELYGAVDRLPGLARFEDPSFLDHLRLAQESGGHAPGQVVDGVLALGGGLLTVSGFLGALALISPLMAVAVLLAAAPVLVAQLRLSTRRAAMTWRIGPVERREFFYGSLLASVAAAKELRLFGAGRYLRDRMLADRRAADAQRRRMDRRELFTQGWLSLLSAGVAGAGLVWAIASARAGRSTAGDVTMFVAAVAGVQGALSQLTTVVAQAHQQLLLFEHFLAVTRAAPDLPAPGPLTAEPAKAEPAKAEPVMAEPATAEPAKAEPGTSDGPAGALPALRHGIELRDVWFRYSDQHPWALRGVDLFLPYGASIALVGRNGAGKSTLVKLLCRFYDPTRGAIRWDGVDLRDIPPEQLRQRLSAVFQDFMRYDMTAAENIGLGDVAVLASGRPERLHAGARLAGIHETVGALPRGYDTLLTRMFADEVTGDDPETGVVLSGGQWQRIALARAFLRDERDLLILDEPSSGLDAVAEHEMHSRLRAHRDGRTSVLISHRLGAVRDADRIVVLSEGRIVEQGTHDALMAADGEYAELFRLQAEGYQTRGAVF